MALTQLSIDIPSLSDNSKKMEVEGAIAVGEKVAVTVTGLPADVSTSAKELRLRVLGPMGEDLATHGDWAYGGGAAYGTNLDLASVQAYRLFFPPPPPPPRVPPQLRPVRHPTTPAGYDPVAAAAMANPPSNVTVKLVLELRDKDGSDSDADLLDASLLGTASVRLNYWPVDWQAATLVDLANGKVYSKEEVDALIADEKAERVAADSQEASLRSEADSALSEALAAETTARISGDGTNSAAAAAALSAAQAAQGTANSKYAKPVSGIPKGDLANDVQASLAKADSAVQDISGKADLVGGKVPASQLPSYVDDVLEFDSLSDFPAAGEDGKIYVAKDTNKTYRWTGTQYVEVGGGEAPVLSVNGRTGAVTIPQADWDESDSDDDAFVRNKPTIPDDSTLLHNTTATETKAGPLIIARDMANKGYVRTLEAYTYNPAVIVSGPSSTNTSSNKYIGIKPDKIVAKDSSVASGATREFTLPVQGGELATGPTAKSVQVGDYAASGIYGDTENPTLSPDSSGKITLPSPTMTVRQGQPKLYTPGVVKLYDYDETVDPDFYAASAHDGAATPALVGKAISGKANKVANATSGNFAGLDANGNLTDSGKKASDFATKSDATLAERSGFTDWTGLPAGRTVYVVEQIDENEWAIRIGPDDGSGPDQHVSVVSVGEPMSATFTYNGQQYTITRTVNTGYQLGAQSNKPLAKDSEFQSHKADTTAHITASERTAWNAKYEKPSGGIPASDIASGVIPSVSDRALSASLAPAFSTSSTYAVGDFVTYQGALYKCTTAVSTAGAWDASKWTATNTIAEMPAPITVDSSMSTTSTNPVKNKVVKAAIDERVPWGNENKTGVAIGLNTSVGTHNGFASGWLSKALGNQSLAAGYSCIAAGNQGVALGNNSAAAGNTSVALGWFAVAAAGGSGESTTNPHDFAFVWQGDSSASYYYSNGNGTFNINPSGGAAGFWIGEKKLTEVIAENTNYLLYASTTTLAPETAVYRSALNADGTFPTITDSGIPTVAAYYQFELELTVPSTVPSTITGPSGWTWLDGHGLPDPTDLSGGETICISVRLDCTARTFLASVWRVA